MFVLSPDLFAAVSAALLPSPLPPEAEAAFSGVAGEDGAGVVVPIAIGATVLTKLELGE